MPRKPNYKFERFERDRKKAAKKAERAEAKREKAAQRRGEQEPGAPVDENAVIEEDATD
jgi:hypothetical protein